ncbi:MAG: hypothetical protein Phog2KO_00810 [Phototrophicaceae bacterium]
MDWSQFFVVFIVFSILWILAQRISERHQRTFRIFIILFAMGWMYMRLNLFFWELILGIIASLVMSFLFWVLIGRYNPVGNKDEEGIKVYGLDD